MSRAAGSIRRARPEDVPRICDLVRELADYERARDEAQMSDEQLRAALFEQPVSLYAHVAEIAGAVVGFAVWFRNFSTWRGRHGIYLEDLIVVPEHRGSGLGKALLAGLAHECLRQGYARLEWSVLDWNAPSIDFYRSLGAVAMHDWTVFRLTGTALEQLAETATGAMHSSVREDQP